MSTFAGHDVVCRCGAAIRVDLADSVHAATAPRLRDAILAGTFHTVGCQTCGQSFRIEKTVAYTDFKRRQWFLTFPPEQVVAYRDVDRAAAASFQATMVERCAPVVREWSTDMIRRTVFGLASLREKLLLFELGLDDRVVELIKLRQAATLGLGLDAHVELAARTGDALLFDVAIGDSAPARLPVAARAYAQLAGLGGDLGEAAGPVVHGAVVDWRIGLLRHHRSDVVTAVGP